MAKKTRAPLQTKKKSKKSKSRIHRKKRQTFLSKLRQVVESYVLSNHDSNDADCAAFRTRSTAREISFSNGDSARTDADDRDENVTPGRYHRREHFLEISPRDSPSQPFCKRVSAFAGQCEVELNFVQAIVWLKSSVASVPRIPLEQLRRIFDGQWSRRDRRRDYHDDNRPDNQNCPEDLYYPENHRHAEHRDYRSENRNSLESNRHDNDAELFEYRLNRDPSTREEEIDTQDTLTISTPLNVPYLSCGLITPPTCKSRADVSDLACNITPRSSIYKSNDDIFGLSCNITPECTTYEDAATACKLNDTSSCSSASRADKLFATDEISTSGRPDRRAERDTGNASSSQVDMFLDSLSLDLESLDLDLETSDIFRNSANRQDDEGLASEELKRLSVPCTQKSDDRRASKAVARDTTDGRDKFTSSPSFLSGSWKKFSKERRAVFVANEQYKSPTKSQSVISNLDLDFDSDEEFMPDRSQSRGFAKDPATTRASVSRISDAAPRLPQRGDLDNSKIHEKSFSVPNDDDRARYEIRIDNPDKTRKDVNAVESPEPDSAYDTLNVDATCDCEVARTTTITDSSKREVAPASERVGHSYNLRPRKKETTIAWQQATRARSSTKKRKRRGPRRAKAGKKCNEGTISAKWLSDVLESLDVDRVILDSVKVILASLADKRTAEKYAICGYWSGTMEEAAVKTVLNVSDVLQTERKPDVCSREIVTTIIGTLDEVMTCVEVDKTSTWMCRAQIIMSLCNSLLICVEVIDHLITKLKSFQSTLVDATEIQQDVIDRCHSLFYVLDIAIKKYRTFVPSARKTHRAETTSIPRVADLSKTRHVDETTFEDTSLNQDAAQERWLKALEDFTVISVIKRENFARFAEKSQSLCHALISQ